MKDNKDYDNFVARMGSFDDTLDITDELKHYGVLGMKWGKRKIQNGPTVERRMSNKELNARIKRLKLETEYKRLDELNTPAKKNYVGSLAKGIGAAAVTTSSVLTIYNNLNKMAEIASKVSKK